jgi:lysophospholipase L1-like esterase
VPAAGEVLLAATLPIGGNQPHTYLAFGDSITAGDGSKNGQGYRLPLEKALRGFFGQATIFNEGWPGTRSNAGASRIGGNLRRYQPAYTLILYGTNDWNECGFTVPCFTIDSLRKIVQKTKSAHSLPVLATLPPANPEYGNQSRNNWTSQINELIRSLAEEEEALLVDLEAAFRSQGDLTQLFYDHVHPNDRGYAIMADEFFKAITQPVASGMSSFDDFVPDAAAPRDAPLVEPEAPAPIPDPAERPLRSVREG